MADKRKKTVKTTVAPMVLRATTTHASLDDIAAKAYELFVARGGEHGHDLEDWLAAEAALAN